MLKNRYLDSYETINLKSSSNNCKTTCKNGTCLNFGDGSNLVCTCNPGFSGKNCDKPDTVPDNSYYPEKRYDKCGRYHCMREGTRFCANPTGHASCVCLDDYTGPQCETVKPYQPPAGKPNCDSVNPFSGYNRVEIGWTSNNCNNVNMTEPDYNVETLSYEGRKRLIRNNCANYYYSPFVGGTDVICDGVPTKKSALEWECSNGTHCKT
jgi:hypothetical protein